MSGGKERLSRTTEDGKTRSRSRSTEIRIDGVETIDRDRDLRKTASDDGRQKNEIEISDDGRQKNEIEIEIEIDRDQDRRRSNRDHDLRDRDCFSVFCRPVTLLL